METKGINIYKVETKFKLGENVFFKNRIKEPYVQGKVVRIIVIFSVSEISIMYRLSVSVKGVEKYFIVGEEFMIKDNY